MTNASKIKPCPRCGCGDYNDGDGEVFVCENPDCYYVCSLDFHNRICAALELVTKLAEIPVIDDDVQGIILGHEAMNKIISKAKKIMAQEADNDLTE